MTKLFSGGRGAGSAGKTYEADKSGWVEVPDELVPILLEHGFATTDKPPTTPTKDLEKALARAQADLERSETNGKALAARVAELESQVDQLTAPRSKSKG